MILPADSSRIRESIKLNGSNKIRDEIEPCDSIKVIGRINWAIGMRWNIGIDKMFDEIVGRAEGLESREKQPVQPLVQDCNVGTVATQVHHVPLGTDGSPKRLN